MPNTVAEDRVLEKKDMIYGVYKQVNRSCTVPCHKEMKEDDLMDCDGVEVPGGSEVFPGGSCRAALGLALREFCIFLSDFTWSCMRSQKKWAGTIRAWLAKAQIIR